MLFLSELPLTFDPHEAHVDKKNKVVTTPAFMCETKLHLILMDWCYGERCPKAQREVKIQPIYQYFQVHYIKLVSHMGSVSDCLNDKD